MGNQNVTAISIIAPPQSIAAKVNDAIQLWYTKGIVPTPVVVSAMSDGENLIVAISPKSKDAENMHVFGISDDVTKWVRGNLFNNSGDKGLVVLGKTVWYWGTNQSG